MSVSYRLLEERVACHATLQPSLRLVSNEKAAFDQVTTCTQQVRYCRAYYRQESSTDYFLNEFHCLSVFRSIAPRISVPVESQKRTNPVRQPPSVQVPTFLQSFHIKTSWIQTSTEERHPKRHPKDLTPPRQQNFGKRDTFLIVTDHYHCPAPD